MIEHHPSDDQPSGQFLPQSGTNGQSMTDVYRQRIIDDEHLKLLSFFHYFSAGTTALFACIPIIHFAMGLIMVLSGQFAPAARGEEGIPVFIGGLMMGIAAMVIVGGWTLAFLKFLTGKYIRERRKRVFCMVISGIGCLSMPYGTILGVLTIIALQRETIKHRFS